MQTKSLSHTSSGQMQLQETSNGKFGGRGDRERIPHGSQDGSMTIMDQTPYGPQGAGAICCAEIKITNVHVI